MRGLKIGVAVLVVLVAVWIVSPAFRGYHVSQGSADTQCLSQIFLWCKDTTVHASAPLKQAVPVGPRVSPTTPGAQCSAEEGCYMRWTTTTP